MLGDRTHRQKMSAKAVAELAVLCALALGLCVPTTLVAVAAPTPTPAPVPPAPRARPPVRPAPSVQTPTPAPRLKRSPAVQVAQGSTARRLLSKRPWVRMPASAARPPAAPGDLDAFVFAECQQGSKETAAEASVFNESAQPATVFFAATRQGRAVDSGRLDIPPGDFVDFAVAGLTAGAYQLTFANQPGGPPVFAVAFRVLECISVDASCAAVTFSNPASNPAVEVLYGDRDKPEPDDSVIVGPGAERTVRTTRTTLDYLSVFFGDTSAEASVSLAGEGDVAVPNGACRAKITSVRTDCADPGTDNGSARAELDIEAGQRVRFEVTRAGSSRVIARGTAPVEPKDSEYAVAVSDLRRDDYVLRVYVGNEDKATDRERFTVRKCRAAAPAPAPADDHPEPAEPAEPPASTDDLAATGGVSPLLVLGPLLALVGGGLLLVRRRGWN